MFVPPEQRSIPPRWEPPPRRPVRTRREDRTTALISLVMVAALFGPELVGTAYVIARAMIGH